MDIAESLAIQESVVSQASRDILASKEFLVTPVLRATLVFLDFRVILGTKDFRDIQESAVSQEVREFLDSVVSQVIPVSRGFLDTPELQVSVVIRAYREIPVTLDSRVQADIQALAEYRDTVVSPE